MMRSDEDIVNGINVTSLRNFASAVDNDHDNGKAEFGVVSTWIGATRSQARVSGWQLGGQTHVKDFVIDTDEPFELLGSNQAPNPQELLMAALNACMIVGYVANAALRGIKLEKLTIETHGELDLRGFLELDRSIAPGNEEINYTVTMRGDGTEAQMREIHDAVIRTSPNRWNIANVVNLNAAIVIE